VVEPADVLACQGLLPDRYIPSASTAQDEDTGVRDALPLQPSIGSTAFREAGHTDLASATPALIEGEEDAASGVPATPETAACEDAELIVAAAECENVTNEPKVDDDVITTQHDKSIEVVADSGALAGLDTAQTNPRPASGQSEIKVPESEARGPRLESEIRNPPTAACGGTSATSGEVSLGDPVRTRDRGCGRLETGGCVPAERPPPA
jgi:hypothetical protein